MAKKLIDQVDDAFNYFNGYRLEETNTDDTYYIKALMKYIEVLESDIKEVNRILKIAEKKFQDADEILSS
tara:strand:+ start:1900 stop:2109 length:210 start_codon:yes stop_codon:yes gene_type:complete